MRERRREAQPSGIKTFGSTFKNPEDQRAEGRTAGQLLEAAGCRGLRVGGARFSEKHANFVENDGRGDHRRRARADGRGPPPRPRALRRRARARGPASSASCAGRRAGSCEAPGAGRRSLAVARRGRRLRSSCSRTTTVEPTLTVALPTAVIGSGEDAVGVSADGTLLVLAAAARGRDAAGLPLRAAEERPARRPGARAGPGARRRAGAAAPLHRGQLLRRKRGGRELRSGIELRFGDASRAAQKWRSAAAVLADPSITALDYVDLHRPAARRYGGPRCRRPKGSAPAAAHEPACAIPRAERLARLWQSRQLDQTLDLRVRVAKPSSQWSRVSACRMAAGRLTEGLRMPYVERNFRGSAASLNP